MWFIHKGHRYKILKAKISNKQDVEGKIINLPLTVACSEQSLDILEIQAEGKKPLNIKEFVLGNNQFQLNEKINNG
jgi:methionyl-tRNA formyltransferase